MKIAESGENYLETILLLSEKKDIVRSVDIAAELNFSKPSVSRAMGILKRAELIDIDPLSGEITLTPAGIARAGAVLDRHEVIGAFLRDILGVDPETAQKDACRIEHIISEETFGKMRSYLASASDESQH